MSGVTSSQRSTGSSGAGTRTLAWLNIELAFSSSSNATTAAGGTPSAAIAANLTSIESASSSG